VIFDIFMRGTASDTVPVMCVFRVVHMTVTQRSQGYGSSKHRRLQ